jgi:hypothetical protein
MSQRDVARIAAQRFHLTTIRRMNPQDFFARAMQWLPALSLGTLAAFVLRRVHRNRSHWHQHVQRLAAEIIDVAESIQVDLQALPLASEVTELAQRCSECRGRAEQASGRKLASPDALEEAIGQLHDDHRRVVDLRSDLDAHIARRRTGLPVMPPRKPATGSSPGRSRWASTSLHTSSSFG